MPELKPRILDSPSVSSDEARKHFEAKLALETDPSDVHEAMEAKVPGIVVIDGRSPETFAKEHIKGAINLWHRRADAQATASFDKQALYVCYCSSVACNASTKLSAKLSALGFRVKELIGGIEAWKEEGYSVESGA